MMKPGEDILTTRRERLRYAQALVRQYVPTDVSLVDELIADRRAEDCVAEDVFDASATPIKTRGTP